MTIPISTHRLLLVRQHLCPSPQIPRQQLQVQLQVAVTVETAPEDVC